MSPGLWVPLLFSVAVAVGAPAAPPCLRPSRAGTQVQGDVRVCPGRYRIADPGEMGVIIAAASGTRIDLSGVTLESGDSVPSRFTGIGVASRGVDGVTVLGGIVRGYRFGVRIEGGRGHRVSGIDVSGSRSQALAPAGDRPDSADRLDPYHLTAIDGYGGGVSLLGTVGATVTRVVSRGAQNGIGMVDSRESYVADNDLMGNSGWALHLWHSSHNTVVRNQAGRTRRCESGRRLQRRRHPGSRGKRFQHLQRQRPHRIERRRARHRSRAAHPGVGRKPLSPERRLARARERVRRAPHLGRHVHREPG